MVDKFYYISLQYNRIYQNNLILIKSIDSYNNNSYNNLMKISSHKYVVLQPKLLKLVNNEELSIQCIGKIIENNKNIIIYFINKALCSSYLEWFGLKDSIYPEIYEEALYIIKIDFESKFSSILRELNCKIIDINKAESDRELLSTKILQVIIENILENLL